ncbi:MAG: bifunctional phosphoribosylaminoimidazolecarboxamide formyltransferase/IMP cyclohydrolase, partial [bacterium]
MTDEKELGLRQIRRALISVSDKTGIVDFARALKEFDVEIISTGGTAKALRGAGIAVLDVSDVTGFPEMMDGRIKTLHPKIHGALLGLRDNSEHEAAMREHGIEPIDMVVVNLYPFAETIKREGVTLAEAVEQIDIGGPAMIRSAAKNFQAVAVITSTDMYSQVIDQLTQQNGSLTFKSRLELANLAFIETSTYDSTIWTYLLENAFPGKAGIDSANLTEVAEAEMPSFEAIHLGKLIDLRYGENPHQKAALYEVDADELQTSFGVGKAELLSGKEMSFNNYVDADAAWQLVCDFDEPACAIIKHTNPAGVALGTTIEEAYRRALATDPTSAFGGVVASNLEIDEAAARAIIEIFTEVLIAPDYQPGALEILKTKKNLRVLKARERENREDLEYKQISGGMLVQTRDTHKLKRQDLKVVTKREPTEDEIRDLRFAWTVCKHTKSNAIVYARDEQTVGVG